MHAYRFYIPPGPLSQDHVKIAGPDAHHAVNVLRLGPGDIVILFDGEKYEYSGEILSVKRGELAVGKVKRIREELSTAPRITLCTALFQKFDSVVEKATELGVSDILPVITERTQVRIRSEALQSKLSRWRKIAISAAMQSNRIALPTIHAPRTFDEVIGTSSQMRLRLIAGLDDKSPPLIKVLEDIDTHPETVGIFIGPPADFTPDELARGVEAGLVKVRLTANTLRTETAALSTLAIVSSFFYSRSAKR